MNSFINLSTRVINKFHIVQIIKKSNKYNIHMSNSSINGFCIISSDGLDIHHNIIEICKNTNIEDYNTITDFILETTKQHRNHRPHVPP